MLGKEKNRSLSVEVAVVASHFLSLALPLSMIHIFDRVIPAEGYATLLVLSIFLLMAAAGETVTRSAAAAIQSGLSAEEDLRRTTKLVHNALYSRNKLSEQIDPVELQAQFVTSERLRAMDAGDLRRSRFDFLISIAFVGFFGAIAPSLVWVLMLALGVMVIPGGMVRKLVELQDERMQRVKRQHDFLVQTIAGIESIKGIQAEPFMVRRFEALSAGSSRLTRQITSMRGIKRARSEVAVHAVPVVMALAGAWPVAMGEMSAGTLAAAILLSGRAVQPLMRAVSARDAKRGLASAKRRLDQGLSTPALTGGDIDAPKLQSLEAKNVTVLDADGIVRLDSVSAQILCGGALALTGPSGSGKSLLLQVLSGQLIPDSGTVLWNGEPIQRFDADSISRRVITLLDMPRLPAKTVSQYLTDGAREKMDDALEAAVALGIGKDLASSPEGLQSRLGPSGSGLLPSLEVRLPMARAFARKPDLILFDDANNNLDFEADKRVIERITNRSKNTAFAIATARPSYLRLAQQTIEMQAGRVLPANECLDEAA